MWTCTLCGTQHSSLPLCFGLGAPWRALVPEPEFDRRVALNPDQCIVDGEHYFVRGHIELPISGTVDSFAWSVWCSVSEPSFRHISERWEDPERPGDGYFGWLCSSLPVYPNTLHLKANVLARAVGHVFLIEVQECDHPLYVHQRDGVTLDQVRSFAHQLLHSNS